MILRSVTKHIKEQNWFAVGLDLLIVVFGVFIGLQVANWNESLNDKDRATAYLNRIHADILTDIDNYQIRTNFWGEVKDYGLTGLDYVNSNEKEKNNSYWEVLLAFYQASQISEFYTKLSTYNELTSSGDLRLINNIKLRDSITVYYTNAGNPAMTERPKYREGIRGVVPVNIQLYIWENCWTANASTNQVLLACKSPIEDAIALKVITSIKENNELISELRYWISTLRVATLIARDRTLEANNLKKTIEVELGDQLKVTTP